MRKAAFAISSAGGKDLWRHILCSIPQTHTSGGAPLIPSQNVQKCLVELRNESRGEQPPKLVFYFRFAVLWNSFAGCHRGAA
jgi:hypothetical protein